MRNDQLARVDLNLLVALNALLAEKSVTRAAGRLGLTQPAMSHALRRLRALFDDPLLVRTPRGMLPTAKAQRLDEPVQRILADVARTFHGEPAFDPRTARRTFTIFASDYCAFLLLPRMLARLSSIAPGVDLVVRTGITDYVLALEDGRLDVLLGVYDQDARNAYKQKLFRERFVCMVRRDHPQVKQTLRLDDYVSVPHLLVAPRGARPGGYIDDELAKRDGRRRIALTVPHFLLAPHIVASSDLILTVAERIARVFADLLPLRILEPPIKLSSFTISQYWHERQHNDPAHVWFRSVVAEVCKEL
jgi:DNA-binding transcriptional LysR family regulator